MHSFDKPFNSSVSQILESDNYRAKKFTLDEIPTKGNQIILAFLNILFLEKSYETSPVSGAGGGSSYDETYSKILNFKEFYENSKLNISSTTKSKNNNNRSKSSFIEHTRRSSAYQHPI